jgi:ATP-binding cassette subfamily F protein 3
MTERERLAQIETLEFSFNEKYFNTTNMLKAEAITFGYSKDTILINDLSFEVAKGDRICVIGKNGKGKSTLLKILAGKLKPLSGEVSLHDNTQLGYFGQTNIDQLDPTKTIVQEYLALEGVTNMTKVRSVCGALMFSGDLADKSISILSGGEKSRVMLGKILLSPTNLLLLDEPTNHLDMDSCDSLIAALDVFGGASIVVTHNEMFLHHLATKLIIFDHDNVFCFNGTYKDFLDKQGFGML